MCQKAWGAWSQQLPRMWQLPVLAQHSAGLSRAHGCVSSVTCSWLWQLGWGSCTSAAPVVQESCASAGQRGPWHRASTVNKCSVLSPALFTCLRPASTAQFASVRFHWELPQNRSCVWSACLECCLSHACPWKWQMLPGKVLAGTVFLI